MIINCDITTSVNYGDDVINSSFYLRTDTSVPGGMFSYHYDNAGRLKMRATTPGPRTSIRSTTTTPRGASPASENEYASIQYQYNAAGDVLKTEIGPGLIASESTPPDTNFTYGYDQNHNRMSMSARLGTTDLLLVMDTTARTDCAPSTSPARTPSPESHSITTRLAAAGGSRNTRAACLKHSFPPPSSMPLIRTTPKACSELSPITIPPATCYRISITWVFTRRWRND